MQFEGIWFKESFIAVKNVHRFLQQTRVNVQLIKNGITFLLDQKLGHNQHNNQIC